VVEDAEQLEKFLEIRDRLPNLRMIVQYRGQVKHTLSDRVISWATLLKLGEGEEMQEELVARGKVQHANTCCTLIYTSGTTGNPKVRVKC